MRAIFVFTVLIVLGAAAYAAETITYKYDGRGRLTQVVRSGTVNNGMKSCYVLDKAGNRTRVTVVNGTCPTS
jgi:hypothetical protein